jgi:putative membrane-bound dehydrogenase-like protein
MKHAPFLFLATGLLLACQPKSGTPPPPASPELRNALASFEVADGFTVELVAAEPLIADPVAMEIDEDGRMYVVEMHGYPLDLSGSGKIKLLKDTNGDGYPDRSTVFAEGLKLPTGLLRHQRGVLVTDAPDVWYLEDTNGDDRADVKRKILTGFALSNPQHNLNTPVFGPDNWIYLAHQWAITPTVCKEQFSDEGTEVFFPEKPDGPRLGTNGDDRNVRFKPDSHELEALSGESQFGHTFDAWGHHFLVENARHAYQEVLAARYLKRNPHLLVSEAVQDLPDHDEAHGNACEVFPITENPNHQLLTDVGVMTSACGITWYGGGAFPKPYDRDLIFVAEPVHNLVHVDKLKPQGASFVASRVEEKKEFLASKDAWFRPVNFYVGPDGALYVVDYYRKIVEHPEWMSDEVNRSGALYHGTDKGRIYRIVPKNGLPMDWLGKLNLSKKSDEELVKLLEHENTWWRRTAQRLLFERKTTAVEALRRIALRSELAEARVPALWLLDGLGHTSEDVLAANLQHATPGVRQVALRIAEARLKEFPGLEKILVAMVDDADTGVRFQLLCSLGFVQSQQAAQARLALLSHDLSDKWVQFAAISAAAGREMELFQLAAQRFGGQPSEAKATFFAYLAATIANADQPAQLAKLVNLTTATDTTGAWWRAAALSGLERLWRHRPPTVPLADEPKLALLRLTETAAADLRRAALDLLGTTGLPASPAVAEALDRATHTAADPTARADLRADAVRLLALRNPVAHQPTFERLLATPQPLPVRQAALTSLDACAGSGSFVLKNWSALPKEIQDRAVDVLLRSPQRAHQLLDAVAAKVVSPETIGWRRTVRLMNNDDVAVRAHARKVLAVDGLTRESVLGSYRPALRRSGDGAKGEKIFARVCAGCHRLDGQGVAFGPDLASIRNRDAGAILQEIIVPNHSIADKYEYWHLTLKNGQTAEGIIAAKTGTTLTLRQLGGQEQVIARADVKNLEASKTSAMPDGLEKSISVAEMADLLAYLKKGK